MKPVIYYLLIFNFSASFFLYPQIPAAREFTLPQSDSLYNSKIITLDNNNLAAFWIENSKLYFSKTSDFGINWLPAINLQPTVSLSNTTFYSVTVTNTGRIILIYKNNDVFITYSDDNGESFSNPQQVIITNAITTDHFKLTQSTTGQIFFSYTKVSGGVYYKKSSDNGQTWENEISVHPSGIAKGTYSSPNGNIHIFFSYMEKLFKRISTDNGVTWDAVSDLGIKKNCSIILAGDTLYTGFENDSSADIYFEKSTDYGENWFGQITFTKYPGKDNTIDLQTYQNNVLFSFSSERASNLTVKVHRYFGILNVTEDINTPPILTNLDFIRTQWYNIEFSVEVEVLDNEGIESVILHYDLNGLADSINMISSVPGKYQINFPGQDSAYIFNFNVRVNDIDGNSVLFEGESAAVNEKWVEVNTLFNVNKIILPLSNSGVIGNAFIPLYPYGGTYEGNGFLFSGGFFLSGKTNNQLWANAVASADLLEDYYPGIVNSDPNDSGYVVYTVRSSDSPFGESWQVWSDAVESGADFYDGNNDGFYTPIDLNNNGVWDLTEDRPDLIGDRTSWCVFNDGKPDSLRLFNDVSPQGIEIHQSVFGNYPINNQIENIVYIRYRINNKGTVAPVMDSIYFGVWSDPDLGDYTDDLMGTDTILNSIYVYNDGSDAIWGTNPPAFFQQIVQGPLTYIPGETFVDNNGNGIYDHGIDTPLDSAKQNKGLFLGSKIFPGAKNLPTTSSVDLLKSHPTFGPPVNKTEAWYYMHGKLKNGNLIDPCSWSFGAVQGGVNCSQINPLFIYSGDPVASYGWINYTTWDHRMMANTGPFKLKVDEPVDIIVAYVIGRGDDQLNSITEARRNAVYAKKYYNTNFTYLPRVGVDEDENENVLSEFILYQNYPNPFNPVTKIKYKIPETMKVSLKIYDILGREVQTIINKEQSAGIYEVEFNGSSLSSGIYFYELKAGSFSSTKKMILIK